MKKIQIILVIISFFLLSACKEVNTDTLKKNEAPKIDISNSSSLNSLCKESAMNYYLNNKELIFDKYKENKDYIKEMLQTIYFNKDNHSCIFLVSYLQIENGYKSYTFYKSEPYKSFEKSIYFENSNEKYGFGNDEKLNFDLDLYIQKLLTEGYSQINPL